MVAMSSFDEILKELMQDNNLTCRNLAEATHISSGSISLYKRGNSSPSIKNVIKIARYFNCSIDYILGRTLDKGQSSNKSHVNFIDRVNSLIEENNITFYRLAKDCMFSESLHCDWNKGAMPLIETLVTIADYFCVSTDYLLGLVDKR